MEDGSATNAKITTLKVAKSASDARRAKTQQITRESLSTCIRLR